MNELAPGRRGLVLVGYRGTGKSTVGGLLAPRLGLPFVDADATLEARFGRTIAAIFAERGEQVFRDWEEQVLADLTAAGPSILASGGGAVVRESNRQAMRRFGDVVWLSAEPPVLLARLGSDPEGVAGRPALTASGTLAEIADVLAARVPLYRAVADAVVATDGRTPAEVAEAVLAALSRGGLISGPGGRGGAEPCS
jgi:shikimate kinase